MRCWIRGSGSGNPYRRAPIPAALKRGAAIRSPHARAGAANLPCTANGACARRAEARRRNYQARWRGLKNQNGLLPRRGIVWRRGASAPREEAWRFHIQYWAAGFPFSRHQPGEGDEGFTARTPAVAAPAVGAATCAALCLRSGGSVPASTRISAPLPRACTAARRTVRTASAGPAPRAG